ncbi:MAG: tetratricopeptide repeat protein [Myxococcales bacterium]|nr:tetratricopeptide repeat protein [Myxococcales bacterium]
MRLVQLEPANSGQQGDRVYRTVQPCRALATLPDTHVVTGTWLSRAARTAAAHADVLVLCKVVDPDLLPLVRQRRKRGLVTVFEINDDFTDIQPWNTTAAFYAQPENRSLVFQLARISDALQFSSPGLSSKFGSLNRRTLLLPNQLWSVGPHKPRTDKDWVTIGWGGSLGHQEDLKAAIPALRAVLDKRPRARVAIMGDPRLRAMFAWAPGERFSFTRTGSLAAYQAFLGTLDIGVAPLLDTPFNRGRSDVKRIEYAAHGVVAVCADLVPYHASVRTWDNGALFANAEELEAVLLRLVDEPALRTEIAAHAHAQVSGQRLQANHAADQRAFYDTLGPDPSQADAEGFSAIFQALTPDPLVETYRECTPTKAEQHLYNGLLSQGNRKQAKRDFTAACRADPHNYLAHMHLGRMNTGKAAQRSFERALSQAPESPGTHYLRALSHMDSGHADAALDDLSAAVAVAPEYAPAWTRKGALLEQRGQLGEAQAAYASGLEANPDYGVAALALASLQMRQREFAPATRLLESHQEACKDDHRYWMLLGQLALLQRNGPAAATALARAKQLRPDVAAIAELQSKAQALTSR